VAFTAGLDQWDAAFSPDPARPADREALEAPVAVGLRAAASTESGELVEEASTVGAVAGMAADRMSDGGTVVSLVGLTTVLR
jgi:hypothetical protein